MNTSKQNPSLFLPFPNLTFHFWHVQNEILKSAKPNFNFTSLLTLLENGTFPVYTLLIMVLFFRSVLGKKVERLIGDAPLIGAKITYPFSSRVSSSMVTLAAPPSLVLSPQWQRELAPPVHLVQMPLPSAVQSDLRYH